MTKIYGMMFLLSSIFMFYTMFDLIFTFFEPILAIFIISFICFFLGFLVHRIFFNLALFLSFGGILFLVPSFLDWIWSLI